MCTRCGRDTRSCGGEEAVICIGCITFQEDVADTAAFAAACGRVADAATSPEVARRAQRWAELALENLVRRHSYGFGEWPVTADLVG